MIGGSRLNSAAVILSPALTRVLAPQCAYLSETSLRLAGADSNATRVLSEIAKVFPAVADVGFELTSSIVPTAQQAIAPEAIALGVFGGIAGLAVLLIAGLMIGRILRSGAGETDTLRELGADRAMTLGDGLGGMLGALFAGSLLAVAVAIGLSPLALLGPVRPVYPDPGVAFDWTVLGLGLLALIVVLGFARRDPLQTRGEPSHVRAVLRDVEA